MNRKKKRYEGLVGERDYRKDVQIIKNGGYATDSLYVQKICVIIEKYGLTRFDCVKTEKEVWYHVRKSWQDAESQVGAFKVLDWKLLAGAAGIVAAVVFVIWLIFFCARRIREH